ncbi:MAG: aldehyde dehydrogenase family protein, partial [Caldimonas sp.]
MSSTFRAVDPSTGAPGATFQEATPGDVRAAVTAANEAFRAGALRDRERRAALL